MAATQWKKVRPSPRTLWIAIIAFLLLFLFLPHSTFSKDVEEYTFKSSSGKQTANILVRPPEKRISVRVVDNEKLGLPKHIGITLRSSKGNQVELELSAMDGKKYGYYEGLLPSQQDSFVALEVKIPFTKGKPVKLGPPH